MENQQEKRNHLQGNYPEDHHGFLSNNLADQEKLGCYIQSAEKNVRHEYFTWQSCPSEMKKRETLPEKQELK